MRFIPIPQTRWWLAESERKSQWMRLLPEISKSTGEPIDNLLDQIERSEIQIALVLDDDDKAAVLIGIRRCRRGDDLVGDIVWLTGHGLKHWFHLLPQLEQYLHDTGCKIIRPICRKGWARLIEPQGYKLTHYMMEKSLG